MIYIYIGCITAVDKGFPDRNAANRLGIHVNGPIADVRKSIIALFPEGDGRQRALEEYQNELRKCSSDLGSLRQESSDTNIEVICIRRQAFTSLQATFGDRADHAFRDGS